MKKILAGVIIALLVMTGPVFAAPTNVDFGALGLNTVSITSPNSLTLNGVTMFYDNFGSASDFANADQFGIYGTTYGGLFFMFANPANVLKYNFSVLNPTGPDPNAMTAIFSLTGSPDFQVVTLPGDFNAADSAIYGDLDYQGPLFDYVAIFFSPVQLDPNGNPYIFTTDHISYDLITTAVPEPATMLLLGLGLAGVAVARKRFQR